MTDMPLAPAIFVHRGLVTAQDICANVRVNAGRPLPGVEFKRVCVCASGPSLKLHLGDIRKRQALGFAVASMNGSHNFLVENGIIPDLFFMIDARHGVNLPFVEAPNDHTTYVIASQCAPEIFEALEGRKVMLWQVDNYEGAGAIIREQAPHATVFSGAANVGHSCLTPLAAMGYRVWHLFGYDGPVASGETHAFTQPQNAADDSVEFTFQGQTFIGSPTMAADAQAFVDRYRLFREKLGIDIQIFSEGLLPAMVKALGDHTGPHGVPPKAIQPVARTRPVEKLQIVLWKWKGHVPYTAAHVNRMVKMLDRWLSMPAEIVCITDDAVGIDGGIRIVPLWRDHYEHGYDWHRLHAFAPEMAGIIGPRFASMDIDTVICGPLDPLFNHDAPFKAWRDPFRQHQYCTAMFQMDAGAFPHVETSFDRDKALDLRKRGYTGYDQAWISSVLPGQPVWTQDDGVLSFKADVIRAVELPSHTMLLPAGARVINFHGKFDPSHADVQACCPWIPEFYPE